MNPLERLLAEIEPLLGPVFLEGRAEVGPTGIRISTALGVHEYSALGRAIGRLIEVQRER